MSAGQAALVRGLESKRVTGTACTELDLLKLIRLYPTFYTVYIFLNKQS